MIPPMSDEGRKQAEKVRRAIKGRMQDLGITQVELARRVGLRPQAVSKWFAEENPTTPGFDRFPDIEAALDLPPQHLERLILGVRAGDGRDADVEQKLLSDIEVIERGIQELRVTLGLPARPKRPAPRRGRRA